MTKISKTETAFHEAGHAVASIGLGLSFEYVTIVPDGDSLGSMLHPGVMGYHSQSKTDQKKLARDLMLACYAGFQAEKRYISDANEDLAEADYDNAFFLSRTYQVFPRSMNFVGDDFHHAFLDRLKREAGKLVLTHWSAIETIAKALLEKQTLSFEEAYDVIRKEHPYLLTR